MAKNVRIPKPVKDEAFSYPQGHEFMARKETSRGWGSLEEAQTVLRLSTLQSVLPEGQSVLTSKYTKDIPSIAAQRTKQFLDSQTKTGRAAEILDAVRQVATMTPVERIAHARELGEYSGFPAEFILEDKELEQRLQNAKDYNIGQDKMQEIAKRAMSQKDIYAMVMSDGGTMAPYNVANGPTMSFLLKEEAHALLTLDEWERMFDIERGILAKNYRVGKYPSDAFINYAYKSIQAYSIGGVTDDEINNARDHVEAARFYASSAPEVEGWRKYITDPVKQLGLWTNMALDSLKGMTVALPVGMAIAANPSSVAGAMLNPVVGGTMAAANVAAGAQFVWRAGNMARHTTMAMQIIGEMIYDLENFTDDNGRPIELTRDQIVYTALVWGIAEAGLEYAQADMIFGGLTSAAFKAVTPQVLAAAAKPAARVAVQKVLAKRGAMKKIGEVAVGSGKRFLTTMATEQITEGAQAVTRTAAMDFAGWLGTRDRPDLSYTYAKPIDYWDAFYEDATGSFSSFALLVAPGAIHGAMQTSSARTRHYRASVNNVNSMRSTFDSLVDASGKLKLTQRSPTAAKGYYNDLARNSNMGSSTVFVDAQVLTDIIGSGGINPVGLDSFLDRAGIDTDDITVAAASGADVSISVGDLILFINENSSMGEQIRDNMRLSPADMFIYNQADVSAKNFSAMNAANANTMKAIITNDLGVDENNAVYVPVEVIEPMLTSPESTGMVADAFGVTPEILNQAIENNESLPLDVRTLGAANVNPDFVKAVENTVSAQRGGQPYAEIVARALEEKQIEQAVIDRVQQVSLIQGDFFARMRLANVPEKQAYFASNFIANYFEARAAIEGISPQEYAASYGEMEFVHRDSNTFMVPSRANITLGENIRVTLSERANASTIPHEMWHFFEYDTDRQIERLTARLGADNPLVQSLVADKKALWEWLGATEGQTALTDFQREKVADGMVFYLKEGKAPNSRLREVFRRYADWLGKFVSYYFEQGETLPDDVREIYGRMISVQDEADAILAKHGILETTLAGLDMDSGIFVKGVKKAVDAMATAKEKFFAKAIAGSTAANIIESSEFKTRFKEYVENILPNIRPYQAVNAMQKGDGLKLIRSEIIEMIGEAGLKELPDGIVAETGIPADMMATQFKYNNGAEMLNNLRNLPSMETEATARTLRDIVSEYTNDNAASDILEAAVDGADAYAAAMQLKRDVFERTGVLNSKQMTAQIKLLAQKIQNIAETHVDMLDYTKLQRSIETYIAAEARAREAFRGAMKAGDFDSASLLADRIALNVALQKAARTRKKAVISAINGIKKASQLVNRDRTKWRMDEKYISRIEDLLIISGWRKVDAKRKTTYFGPLSELVKEREAAGYPMPIAEWLIDIPPKLNFNSIDSIIALNDALTLIARRGRQEKSGQIEAGKATVGEHVNNAMAQIVDNYGVRMAREQGAYDERVAEGPQSMAEKERGRSWWRMAGYKHLRIANMIRSLDGMNNPYGPVYKAIIEPLRIGGETMYRYQAAFSKEWAALRETFLADPSIENNALQQTGIFMSEAERILKQKRIMIPELRNEMGGPLMLSMEELISFGMNMGTETGNERVMTHLGLTDSSQMDVLRSHIPSRYWDFISATWALNEKYGKIYADLYYKDTGLVMPMEKKNAFVVVPSDTGIARVIEGGYYPIQYDHYSANRESRLKTIREADGQIKDVSAQWSTRMPTQHPGYTKARKKTTGRKLVTDLTVMSNHIEDTSRQAFMTPKARGVMRILADGNLARAISSAFSEDFYRTLLKHVENIAAGADGVGRQLSPFQKLMRNSSFASIAMNMSSAVNQLLSIPTAAAHVGINPMVQSLGYWMGLPVLSNEYHITRAEIEAKSHAMAERREAKNLQQRDYAARNKRLIGKQGFNAFYFSTLMDQFVSYPIWTAEYWKALKEGETDARAVQRADDLIRKSQDLGNIMDMTLFSYDTELGRMFSAFQSANAGMFNTMWESAMWTRQSNITKSEAWGAFLSQNFKLALYPALFAGALKGSAANATLDDDDELGWSGLAAWGISSMAGQLLGNVPGVSAFRNGRVNVVALKGLESVASLGLKAANAYGKFGWEQEGLLMAWADLNGWAVTQDIVNILGYGVGVVPSIATNRLIRATRDIVEGDADIYTTIDALISNEYPEFLRRIGAPGTRR